MFHNIFDDNNELIALKEQVEKNPSDIKPYLKYLNYKTAWRKAELQKSWRNDHLFAYIFMKKVYQHQVSFHIQFIKGTKKSGKNHIFYVDYDILSTDGQDSVNSSVIAIQKRKIKAIMNMVIKGNLTFEQSYALFTKRYNNAPNEDLENFTIISRVSGIIYENLDYLSDIADKVKLDLSGSNFHIISVDGTSVDITVGDVSSDTYTVKDATSSRKLVTFCEQNKKLMEKLTASELLKILSKLGIRIELKSDSLN